MRTAIKILDADNAQVIGLDSETLVRLVQRGQSTFPLPHGMRLELLCDATAPQDTHNVGSVSVWSRARRFFAARTSLSKA